jgi:phage minor structural protein
MELGAIDYNKKPQRPQLFLCKPDRTIIAKLKEAYNINHTLKLGNINELSFSLPIQIDMAGELVDNPHIEMIKGRYLIKLINGNFVEWYIITKITDTADDNGDSKTIECFSLPYELKDKNMRTYSVTSYNATQVLTDILSNTTWTTGYIDADFDLKYRSFDVSKTTVLDFVFQVAETFGALIIWNTENRTINFYKPENIGVNRGLTVSYRKYLKSINKEEDYENVVTRLKVFGKDGLSIQRVNPTGTNYIEDFSYFMYPFQRDANKNVLQHSDYMSDSLCNALLDYQELVESKRGVFADLLSQLETYQKTLAQHQEEYYQIQLQLDIVLDKLDIAQTTGQPTTDLIAQRDDLISQLNAKQAEIDQDNANIQSVQSQIDDLKNTLKIENNFTPEQIKELNQFVIEREWEDQNYIDDQQLYNDAIKIFEKMKIPPLTIKVDIVNLLDIIEEQRNWDKLVLGDIINIKYERLNINVQAQIIEMNFEYEDGNIQITISNTKNIKDNLNQYLDMLYKSVSSSNVVDMNKYKWNNTVATVDDVEQILNNVWDTAKRAIEGGVNNSVTISRRGITIQDPSDPNRFIRMTNGVIGFTNDGGNTFKTVLDASGVYAERLIGRILLGNQLTISDNTGNFTISGSLLTVKDKNNNERVLLGDVSKDGTVYGLRVLGADGTTILLDEQGVHTAGIVDNAVTTSKISDGAVTNTKIADASITTAKIADASITNAKIEKWILGKSGTSFPTSPVDGEVFYRTDVDRAYRYSASTGTWVAVDFVENSNQIADGIITSVKIVDGAITNAKIANAAIDGAKIADLAVTTAKIQDAAITTAKIANAAITTAKIADAAITTAKIANAAIDNAKIAAAAIDTAKIQDGAITNAKIAVGAIDSAKISHAAIDTAHIKAGAITTALIAQGAVGTAQIADGSITDAKIVSLNASKINAGTINTGQVTIQGANGKLKISNNRLQVFDNQPTPVERVSIGDVNNDGTVYGIRVRGADGQTVLYDHNGVYTEGITDGAITNPKISDGAVDSRVIAANSVLADHIVAGAITGDKIAARTITANNIAVNTITADSGVIANGAITNAMIANLDASKITSGYINAARIQAGSITVDKLASNVGSLLDISSNQAIKMRVTQSQLNEAINGINIGGRNLILNSNIENAHAEDEERTATFSRSSVAYLSNGTEVAANVPRYESGKFGKAIMVEEGTTNAFGSSGRLDTDSNNDGLADNVVVYTLISSYSMVSDSWLGTKSQRAVSSGSGNPRLQYNVAQAVSAGQVWTVSIRGKAQAGKTLFLVVKDQTDNTFTGSIKTQIATGSWDLITLTFTIPDDVTSIKVQFGLQNAVADDWFQYCALQLEKKPYATSFIDGTRATETLTIPTAGVLNPQEGTVECWVYVPEFWKVGIRDWRRIWSIGNTAVNGRYNLLYDPTDDFMKFDIQFESIQRVTASKPSVGWHYFATKWSSTEMALFIDGVKVASWANPSLSTSFADTVMAVGSRTDGADCINTLIDDLRISSIARTDEEIAAAYASGQALPVDEYTTWKMDFENSLRPSKPLQRDLSMSLVEGQEYMFSLTSSGKVSARIYSEDDKSDYIYADNGTTAIKFVPENTGEYTVELYSGVDNTEAKVKLEKGNKATDWTPAPEDTTTAIDDATTRIEGRISQITTTLDGITNQVSLVTTEMGQIREYAETLVQQTSTNIMATISQDLLDLENSLIQRYQADLQTTAQDLTLTFSGVRTSLDELSEDMAAFKTTFQFSAEGMEIGRAESPFKLKLTNDKMSFMDSGVEIAYFSTQKMYITEAEILNSIKVGNHLIEKYDDTTTLVRWVG